MGQLAVRAVGLAPFLEQRQDRLGLLGEQAVHRGSTRRGISQAPHAAPGPPPVRTDLTELELVAGPPHRPAPRDGLVDQVQQSRLRGRLDPGRDRATQPQPPFPSTSISFTAISLTVSPRRATSALAASSSKSRSLAPTPGWTPPARPTHPPSPRCVSA